MTVPGMISAVVVLLVFVVLGVMLANRSAASQAPDGMEQAADMGEPTPTFALPTPEMADDGHGDMEAETEAEAEAETEAAADAEEKAAAPQTYDEPPPMTIDPEKDYTATIKTPRGDIVIKLHPDIAPMSVNSFVFLAREGFYDGLTWHRVIDGFMAQGGDPTGTGMGGPGYNIPAEFTDEVLFDRPGIVAMARSQDPDSAGSQFFITTGAAPWLNEQYTPFGEVIEGQEIVDNIPLRDPQSAVEPGEKMLEVTITEE